MGRNSHHYGIDETAKPWSKNVTHESYEIAMGQRCSICRKLNEQCKCKKKKKKKKKKAKK